MAADPHRILGHLSKNGDLDGLRQFLEVTVLSLSREDQVQLCAHGNEGILHVPCLEKLKYLAEHAVEHSQIEVFNYLWDNFLGPGHVQLSPRSLKRTAEKGMMDFAEAFWARDPDCFKLLLPIYFFGRPPEWESQLTRAVGNDQYMYADYMLAHGAQIDGAYPYYNTIRSVLLWGGTPHKVKCRIQFLIDHGASFKGSGAVITAVIKSRDVIPLLLSNGADPSEVLKKEDGNEGEMLWGRIPLIEAAARGYLDTLQLLLRHGADINGADSAGMSAFEAAEQNDRREVIRQARVLISRTFEDMETYKTVEEGTTEIHISP